MAAAAPVLAGLVEPFFGGTLPVRIRAWDGSVAGPAGAPVCVVRSRRVLRRLLWSPNELGLAQAYVTGDLDVEGDLATGLRAVWDLVRERGLGAPRWRPAEMARAALILARLGAIGPRPPAPASQARLTGRLHSRARDRAAISHHYDLSNDFYSLLLDPHMAYSCAYWTSDEPSYTLTDAQGDKLALICAKLGLGPGMRLLDMGCGWGSLSLYAAERAGADVVAVTLSEQQRDYVLDRIAERGLAGQVEVRLAHYREIHDGPYDAVASIEMGEHVGAEHYLELAAILRDLLEPEGRLLIQQMSRRGSRPGGGDFIEAFIAPDMHMRPVGQTIDLLEAAGLEVRDVEAMREHYTRTIRAWLDDFEDRWDEVVAHVGEEVARVWRLYLAGSALTFEEGRMGVDQILAVRPTPTGSSGMPPTRDRLAMERAAH
jgi:cyclopropane-fatty-acyl-phospholipid synthase